jgi:hypothetical protein
VKLDGKVGLIRTDGTWAIEPKFDAAQPLQSDLCDNPAIMAERVITAGRFCRSP